jgi:hypothetical protein
MASKALLHPTPTSMTQAYPLLKENSFCSAFSVNHHIENINQFLPEPIGSPLVRVLFTKGMIAADFLGDPTGPQTRS